MSALVRLPSLLYCTMSISNLNYLGGASIIILTSLAIATLLSYFRLQLFMVIPLKYKQRLNSILPGKILQYAHLLQHPKAIHILELDLIYIPIPKVACHSIKMAFAKKINLNLDYVDHVHLANWNHIKIAEIPKHKATNLTFAFIRNPLDRLVSCYHHKLGADPKFVLWKYGRQISYQMTFREFAEFVINKSDNLAELHFRSQHKFLFENNRNMTDVMFRFETLLEDWAKLSLKYDLPDLAHFNKTDKENYLQYYDHDLALKVLNRFQMDIELLGYSEQIKRDLSVLNCS